MKTKLLLTLSALFMLSMTLQAQVEEATPVQMLQPGVKKTEATVEGVQVKGPHITFEEDAHDFGSVTQGAKVEHTFSFTNSGTEDVLLTNVKASCGCTTPSWSREAVKPGDTGEIKAIFNTAGKSGRQMKSITITYGTNLTRVVYVKGNVDLPTPADKQ